MIVNIDSPYFYLDKKKEKFLLKINNVEEIPNNTEINKVIHIRKYFEN